MSSLKRRNLLVGAVAVDMQLTEPDQIIRVLSEASDDSGPALETLLYEQGIIDLQTSQQLSQWASEHVSSDSSQGSQNFSTFFHPLAEDADQHVDPLETNYIPTGPDSASASHENRPARPALTSSVRYRKLRDYAKGGLGQVFVALDEELKRHVALKQMQGQHAGNADARQRFMLEAEITGGLEHPGIVPVYGLGIYDDGQPYYAMRFIRGESLEQAIADFYRKFPASDAASRRDPNRLLELRKLIGRIIDVCQAIAYAHSRGVLHRDIKPDNIMLGKYGETLVVDWGLAKVGPATSSDVTQLPSDEPSLSGSTSSDSAHETRHGSVIGTPAFMSPEQASGNPDQIDHRSDIYSLGATLYCVLTGMPAYSSRDESGNPISIQNLLERIRAGSFTPPLEIDASIPKPLAAICTRAMAADPANRYSDALTLADELERWLADEPVNAYREPTIARIRRWVKRHQTFATTAVAIALLSVIGLTSFSFVLGQKNFQLDQRRRELQQTNADLIIAEQSANEKAAIATAVTEFLNDDLLSQASPTKSPDPQLQVRSVFKQALEAMQDRFREQPMVKASLLHTIGVASGYLADITQSKTALAEALKLRQGQLGADHPDTLETQSVLGEVYTWSGEYAEAEEALTYALNVQTASQGAESEGALKTSTRLASLYGRIGRSEAASKLIDQAIKGYTRLFGKDALQTLEAESIRIALLAENSYYSESLVLARDLLKRCEATLGPLHLQTIDSMMLVAQQLYFLNRAKEAKVIYQEMLQRIVDNFGDDHPYAAIVRNDLAMIELDSGDPKVALETLQDLEKLSQRRYGSKGRETIISRMNIGNALVQLGRIDDARQKFASCLTDSTETLGPQSSVTRKIKILLASAMLQLDETDQAKSLLGDAVAEATESAEKPTVETLTARTLLSAIAIDEQRYEPAIESLEAIQREFAELQMQRTEESLSATRYHVDALVLSEQADRLNDFLLRVSETFGKDDPITNTITLRAAENYLELDRLATAEKYIDRVQQWYNAQDEHPRETLDAAFYLATLFRQQERYHDAILIYNDLIVRQRDLLGEDHVACLATMHDHAFAYGEIGSHQAAIKLYEDVVRQRSNVFGDSGEYTLVSLENLAGQQMLVEDYQAASQSLKRLSQARTEQGAQPEELIEIHYFLAESLSSLEKYDEAARYYKATIDGETKSLGPLHADTLVTMHRWADALQNAGDEPAAIAAYQQAVAGRTESLGAVHPDTLSSLGSLILLQATLPDSQPALVSIAELQQRISQANQSLEEIIDSHYTIAEAYRTMERYDEAISNYQWVAEKRTEVFGPSHEDTLLALHQAAFTHDLAGNHDAAVEIYTEVVSGRSKTFGPAHPYTLLSLKNSGIIEFDRARYAEADAIFQDLFDRVVKEKGQRHLDTVDAITRLAGTKMMLQQYELATDLFAQTVDVFRQLPRQKMTDEQKQIFGYALIFLGNAEAHNDQTTAAKRHVDEGLELLGNAASNDPIFAVAISVTGHLQIIEKRYDEARVNLMKAWEIQSQFINDRSSSVAALETIDRLIELNKKVGDDAEAEKWIEKRETIRNQE